MSDIFISYSRHDQEWIGTLAKALEDVGYSIWWDTRLLTGDDFHEVIPAALEEASYVIVVWSKVSVTRKWVKAEAARASDRNVLIPIQLEPVAISMPFNLLQADNLHDWNGKTSHPAFQRLVKSIDRFCAKTSTEIKPSITPNAKPQSAQQQQPSRKLLVPALIGLTVASIGVASYPQLQTVFSQITAFTAAIAPSQSSTTEPSTATPILDKPTTIKTEPTQPAPTPLRLPSEPVILAIKTESTQPAPVSRLLFEPEMVSIPAGSFTMGCVAGRDDVNGGCDDNENPPHPVSLPAFQLGKYEVTFDEWDTCERAKACPHADDEGWVRGRRPVINVSWNDITQKYIPWLNQQTGKEYRLPTEAEWEYAARAGGEAAYPWGKTISCAQANYIDVGCPTDRTKEVGSYATNAWGLYDTSGNAFELCYKTGMTQTTTAPALLVPQRGRLLGFSVCCAAGRGSIPAGSCILPIVIASRPIIVTTISVFV